MVALNYKPVCGCGNPLKVFAESGRTALACSQACYVKLIHPNRPKHGQQRDCANCGKAFIALAHGKYCCAECHSSVVKELLRKQTVERRAAIPTRDCAGCGKAFKATNPKQTKWCSRRCRDQVASSWRRAKTVYADPERIVPFKVFDRDGWRCQICGKDTPKARRGTTRSNAPELDHRRPLSKGGLHTYENTQCSCRACNVAKGNKSEAGQMPLFVAMQQ